MGLELVKSAIALLEKRCSKCKLIKPVNQFGAHGGRPDGLQVWCKKCKAAWFRTPKGKEAKRREARRPAAMESNRERNKNRRQDPVYVVKQREWFIQCRHGISVAEREALRADQNYACPVCGTTDPRNQDGTPCHRPWVLDHDHDCCLGSPSCGKCIRGVLCSPCNHLITQRVQTNTGLQGPDVVAYLSRGYVIFHADGTISRTGDILLEMEYWFGVAA